MLILFCGAVAVSDILGAVPIVVDTRDVRVCAVNRSVAEDGVLFWSSDTSVGVRVTVATFNCLQLYCPTLLAVKSKVDAVSSYISCPDTTPA